VDHFPKKVVFTQFLHLARQVNERGSQKEAIMAD
jgi:hypothetical protein